MLNHADRATDPLPDLALLADLAAIPAELQLSFIQNLLSAEQPYPWLGETTVSAVDPIIAETTLAPDWAIAEATQHLHSQWHALSQQLEASWNETPMPATGVRSLQAHLQAQFANRVPADLLARLAAAAQQVSQSRQSLAEQLVHCAQTLVPTWTVDDLQVMARPLAYAFRGTVTQDTVEAALRTVRFAAWTELSGIEQARLSLAIARYALAQAEADPTAPATEA